MRRLLIVVTVVALVSGAVYWAQHRPAADAGADAGPAAEAVPLEVGRIPDLPLADVDDEPPPPPALRPAFDPVVLGPCNLFPAGEQEVASPMDGVCQEVLVQLGQQVRRDQLLARLDDRQVVPQLELLRIKAESRSAERVARALYQDADAKVQYALRANQSGLKAVSDLEYKNYLFQRERYEHEMNRAREEREAAAKELDRVGAQLELHRIRSALAGEVVKVHKRDGETVKQAEPLFRIANFDRLRVEGLCKVSQAASLRVDMPALVEPELRGEPLTRLSGHTAAIHALDSSADGRWLASASEDRTVQLWSWPQGTRRGLLRHPVEVHAVRFAPDVSAPYVLISGAADGQLRRWAIGADGRAGEPLVFAAAHDGAVRNVAISADGRLVASGGEDRRIGIWEAASGRHLYWLHEEDGGDRGADQARSRPCSSPRRGSWSRPAATRPSSTGWWATGPVGCSAPRRAAPATSAPSGCRETAGWCRSTTARSCVSSAAATGAAPARCTASNRGSFRTWPCSRRRAACSWPAPAAAESACGRRRLPADRRPCCGRPTPPASTAAPSPDWGWAWPAARRWRRSPPPA